MKKYYKVVIKPYRPLEKSDRLLMIDKENYLVNITKSNIGNEPKVYTELKNLVKKLLEEEQLDKNKSFTISIRQ